MSRFSFLPLIGLLFILSASRLQAQNIRISDPIKYNDYMVERQDQFGAELLKLIDLFDVLPEDKSVVDGQSERVVASAQEGITAMNKLKPLKGDFGLHQSALELFVFYEETMRTDYGKIIDELYKDAPDLEALNEVLLRIEGEESKLDNAFFQAQNSYAKKHNFSLIENSLQEEFDAIED